MLFFSALLLSMFMTIALVPVFKGMAARVNAIDVPNVRKVHEVPMPKTGGLAMALGTVVPILLWVPMNQAVKSIMLGAAIIVFFGAIDDCKNLSYRAKFLGQVGAALTVMLYGGLRIESLGMLLPDDVLLPVWISIPLTLVVIVGVTNAINLSDGLDGLAGGITLVSFICIAYLAYKIENTAIAVMAVAVAGAIFGFLRFNTYPAELFMGDSGSQFLGFLSITLSISITQGSSPLSPLFPLLLLGFPILDTLTVMVERISEGKSPFVADKKHFHHKLIRLGLFHTEAVLVIYVLQTMLVCFAFLLRFHSEWLLLISYAVFCALVICFFYVAEHKRWTVRREELTFIKGRLKVLKEKNILIKISYHVVEFGVPLLFFISCFFPGNIPGFVGLTALGLMLITVITWVFKKKWLGGSIRLCLYLMIPFVMYFSQEDPAPWVTRTVSMAFNLGIVFVVTFVILTLKFTRRQKGFKTTPMDFLILFVATVIPNLPDVHIQSYHLGFLATKIIVFFFSYEVLIGEVRGEFGRLNITTLGALAVIALRAIKV